MTAPSEAVFDWRQNQDWRSFDHLWAPEPDATSLPASYTRTMGPVIDQGQDGSCTGHGMAAMLGSRHPLLATHEHALALYELATSRDPYPGDWPTKDTGSSVNAAMRAARDIHRVRSWRWLNDPHLDAHAIVANTKAAICQHGPVVIGAPWYSSMDHVGHDGVLTVDAESDVRGGHCFALFAYDSDHVTMRNSWGEGWADGGDAVFTDDGLATLIEGGAELAVASVW